MYDDLTTVALIAEGCEYYSKGAVIGKFEIQESYPIYGQFNYLNASHTSTVRVLTIT